MRALLKIVIFAALAFAYYRWPTAVVGKFETAVSTADRETLSGMMDLEGIRKCMGRDWRGAWEKVFAEQDSQAAAAVNQALAVHPADELDAEILERAFPEDKVLDALIERGRSTWDDGKWESPITYTVTNRLNGTKFTFYFRVSAWKLAGVEVNLPQTRALTRK